MSKKQASKRDAKDPSKKQSTKNSKPLNHQSQQLRRAKQKEMLDNLNRENVQKYMKKLEEAGAKDEHTEKYGLSSIEKIAYSLENGSLIIPENSAPLPEKTPPPLKLTFEEQKEIQVKAKRENIVKKIEYLYEQIRGEHQKSTKKEPTVEFKEILTREEHERRVREIMQEKEERQKRLEQLQEEEEKRLKEEEQKEKSEREAQESKAKEEKRKRIQQSMAKRKEKHEKLLQSEAKQEKERNRPKLYEKMEEKYKSQILMPYLQEKKNKLKELRDFKKQYETEAIKQHEKQYIQKSLQKSMEKKVEPQWKYDPPYRTERLTKALEKEQLELKNHLQARKRRIQEMQSKQQLFKIDLKQKYRPKIDQTKRKEVQSRISEVKREKVVSAMEQRQLGINYLEIAKKLKRSQSVKGNDTREGLISNPSSLKSQTQHSLIRLKNHSQQFYEDFRRKKIDDIVNSQQSSANEKYVMLRMQAQKLGEKIRQKQKQIRNKKDQETEKQAAELILSSIKAKMGIVSLLKQRTEPVIKKI